MKKHEENIKKYTDQYKYRLKINYKLNNKNLLSVKISYVCFLNPNNCGKQYIDIVR